MEQKRKFLIVEDDPYSYMLLVNFLNNLKSEILWVKSGLEAVKTFRENPDIDAVFMDIAIPDINGYEATRRIKKLKPEVLVIAQTAHALAGDREKSLEAGCDDYIAKPLQLGRFKDILKRNGLLREMEKHEEQIV